MAPKAKKKDDGPPPLAEPERETLVSGRAVRRGLCVVLCARGED